MRKCVCGDEEGVRKIASMRADADCPQKYNNDAMACKHRGVAGCAMWRGGDKSLLPRSSASLGSPLDQDSVATILKYS